MFFVIEAIADVDRKKSAGRFFRTVEMIAIMRWSCEGFQMEKER